MLRQVTATAVTFSTISSPYSDKPLHRVTLRNKTRKCFLLAHQIITEKNDWKIRPKQQQQERQQQRQQFHPPQKLNQQQSSPQQHRQNQHKQQCMQQQIQQQMQDKRKMKQQQLLHQQQQHIHRQQQQQKEQANKRLRLVARSYHSELMRKLQALASLEKYLAAANGITAASDTVPTGAATVAATASAVTASAATAMTPVKVCLSPSYDDVRFSRRWYSDISFQDCYPVNSSAAATAVQTATGAATAAKNPKATGVISFETENILCQQGVHLVPSNSSSRSVSGLVHRIAAPLLRLPRTLERRSSSHHSVLVVGAGAAALGAITKLNSYGVYDIVLLEGGDRVGGRVHTLYPSLCPRSPVELGAQWVHGQWGNILYESIMDCQPSLISDAYSTDGGGLFLLPDGKHLSNEIVEAVSKYCDQYEDLLADHALPLEERSSIDATPKISDALPAERRSSLSSEGPKISVRSVFKDQHLWESFLSSQPSDKRHLYQSMFDWFIKWYLADNACADLGQLSVGHWSRYEFCKGEANINPAAGMTAIVHRLYQQTTADIRLNTLVKRIHRSPSVVWRGGRLYASGSNSDAPAVTVACSDGALIGADAVVVTPSIGHLQANPGLFCPPLPSTLRQAVSSMGFGTMNKIILEYREAWWGRYHDSSIQLVWPQGQDGTAHPHTAFQWTQYVTGFDVSHSATPRLTGWVGGPGAVLVESCSHQHIADCCTQLLRCFLDREDIPLPTAVYRSQWCSDPLFHGTYSHPSVEFESNRCSTHDLNTPVTAGLSNSGSTEQVPVLVLAGEANSFHHFSTVHGAMQNGMDQATHLLRARERLESAITSKL